MAIKGQNRLVLRIGINPSDYNKKLKVMSSSAELFSKKVKSVMQQVEKSTILSARQNGVSDAFEVKRSAISSQISALKDIRDRVQNTLHNTPNLDLSTPLSEQIERAEKKLETLNKKRDVLFGKREKALSKGADTGAISEDINHLFAVVDNTTKRLAAFNRVLNEIGKENVAFASVEGISDLDYAIKTLELDLRELTDTENQVNQSAEQANSSVRSMGQRLKSIGSHAPGVRRVSDQLESIGGRSRSSTLDIGRMVNSLRRVALVSFSFRIAGAAMGRLRSIVSEYINDNATLQAQVNGLKAGLGQSLAPAINIVTNAMSVLMPYVLGVSNAIGQLLGALFGSGWTAAANGAQQAATATGGAAAAQKEYNRQLASFDELNKMGDNASSAGGGGIGSSITPIESATPAWLERFRTTFSELFGSEEFSSANIGGKIGMMLQAGLDWIGTEGMEFDWRGAGEKLRDNFDSFLASGWINSSFNTLGILVGGFSDTVIGFLSPEFDEIKREFEANGFSGASAYVSALIKGIPGALAEFVYTSMFSSFFQGISDYFSEKGDTSVSDFFDGISDAMKDCGTWMKENFGDKLIDNFLSSIGLNFPLSPFTSAGRESIAMYLGGLSEQFNSVSDRLGRLREMVYDAADRLKSAFDFDWELPRLRLPHLQVDWDPVDNVLARFFGVSAFPRLSVSWFAKGGILEGAQIFGRMGSTMLGGGEAGREAVLPLDQNTGWMDTIAERVVMMLENSNGGDTNLTIPVTLDGDVITKIVIRGLKKYARANGGLPF